MDLADHIRLHRHQAAWTRPMRRELYRRVRLASRKLALDVGCGDGNITREMAAICKGQVIGVDHDPAMIAEAKKGQGRAEYQTGDAYKLPLERGAADLIACHWLMLWLQEPLRALKEFRRVLAPGGALLIACEPDYGGRMVSPPDAELKDELIAALREQGANPLIGRHLPGLLRAAGFSASCGLYPGLWDSAVSREQWQAEEDWLKTTLKNHMPLEKLNSALAALCKSQEAQSLLMFTPVFWAMGA